MLQLKPPSTAAGHCQSQTSCLQSQNPVPGLGQHIIAPGIHTQKKVFQQTPLLLESRWSYRVIL